jgi:hypothetical protein
MRRLARLVGTWKVEGRSLDSNRHKIRARIKIEWLPGGFFMLQRGWIRVGRIKIRSMEIVGYDPRTDTFPSHVYSELSGVPSRYNWDVRGNVVEHWTDGAKYTGRFSADGNRLSGGWRPARGRKRTSGNTYDATMYRVK